MKVNEGKEKYRELNIKLQARHKSYNLGGRGSGGLGKVSRTLANNGRHDRHRAGGGGGAGHRTRASGHGHASATRHGRGAHAAHAASRSGTWATSDAGASGHACTAAASRRARRAGVGSLRSAGQGNVDKPDSWASESVVVSDGSVGAGHDGVHLTAGEVARQSNGCVVAREGEELGSRNTLDDGKVLVARRRGGVGGGRVGVRDGDLLTRGEGAVRGTAGEVERGEGGDRKASIRGARLDEGRCERVDLLEVEGSVEGARNGVSTVVSLRNNVTGVARFYCQD